MTVRIGSVWDSTQQVLAGRAGMLAPFAAIGFVLPTVVQLLLMHGMGAVAWGSVAAMLLSLVLGIWAQLAIMALATHPATTSGDAARAGRDRFLPVLGVAIVLGFVLGLALLVPVIVLASTDYDFAALVAANGNPALMPAIPGRVLAFLTFYLLAFGVIAIWLGVRLMLTYAVALNERCGLGAYRRSFALTRGLTWRLIGVSLLFLIVISVAGLAVQGVAGAALRLILGPDRPGILLGLVGLSGAIVNAGFLTLAYVFVARLYVATAGERHAPVIAEDGTPSL
ncbi:hypothetical protein [Sphingomonas sp.]|uniref:hypothetical protein n=1 Tax=Sphingomonas sp. TaxID=28214 RepID=UPI0031DAD2AD